MSSRNSKEYRKIYEEHTGPIPVDEDGRTFDVHHIDGNHSNNHPSNLKAVSIKEHFEIHRSQGDYQAASLIALRLKLKDESRRLLSLAQRKRVKEGRHHLCGESGRNIQLRLLANGTHNFSNGFHKKLVEEGRHNMLGGEIQRKHNQRRLKDGTHHLLKDEKCPHCDKTGRGMIMKRWHFDNCKNKS